MLQLLAAEPAPKGRRPIRALVLTPTRELAIQIDECCRDYARYTHHPPLRDLRRRQPASAGRRAPEGRGPAGGHPGPPARPDRAGLRDARRRSVSSCSTRPTACWTWASSTTSAASCRCFPNGVRRSSSRPRCPRVDRRAGRENPPQPGAGHRHAPGVGGRDHQRRRVHVRRKSREKSQLLIDLLLGHSDAQQVLVFSRTKHGADKHGQNPEPEPASRSCAIHGNKSQNARVTGHERFQVGRAAG